MGCVKVHILIVFSLLEFFPFFSSFAVPSLYFFTVVLFSVIFIVLHRSYVSCFDTTGGPSIGSALSVVGGFCAVLCMCMAVGLTCCVLDRHSNDKAAAAAKTFGQIKLLVSFLQILSSMPVAFDSVPWPENFKNFALNMDWINLDFLSVLIGPDTCSLSLSALDRLAVHALVPPMLLAACLCAYGIALLTKIQAQTKERTHLRKVWWEATAKALILIILLLYPGIANRAFSMFRCKEVDGMGLRLVLSSDYNEYCYEGLHATRIGTAVACLVICE